MCGIGGILLYPKDRLLEELVYIKALVKGIAIENESRGHDSTGFVSFSKRSANLFKQPMRASRLVKTEEFQKYLNTAVSPTTMNVLIHTRAGTKGTELNNLNNHPIETQHYFGVHNGIIWNDDELFTQHKLFRAAQVDSEVIFRLMDTAGDKPKTTDIKSVAEKLSGSFTVAFVPKKEKNKLFIVRNDNPVTLVYIPELNIIAFASEKRFLREAINLANASFGHQIAIDEENCFWIEPHRQSIYEFDVSIDNPYEQLNQVPSKFTENSDYGWWAGYEDQGFFQIDAEEKSTTSSDEQEKKKQDILASILTHLTSKQMEALDDYVDNMSNNAWTEGYQHGRESIGKEIEQKIGIAFEEGFQKGYEDGYEDAPKESEQVIV